MGRLINIGYGNVVNTDMLVSVVSPDSAPVKRLIQHAKDTDKVVDATQGRKTKSVIVTDCEYIILSALMPDTIVSRFKGNEEE